jgi:hypothetical protein
VCCTGSDLSQQSDNVKTVVDAIKATSADPRVDQVITDHTRLNKRIDSLEASQQTLQTAVTSGFADIRQLLLAQRSASV